MGGRPREQCVMCGELVAMTYGPKGGYTLRRAGQVQMEVDLLRVADSDKTGRRYTRHGLVKGRFRASLLPLTENLTCPITDRSRMAFPVLFQEPISSPKPSCLPPSNYIYLLDSHPAVTLTDSPPPPPLPRLPRPPPPYSIAPPWPLAFDP